jgi:hypothetical protein
MRFACPSIALFALLAIGCTLGTNKEVAGSLGNIVFVYHCDPVASLDDAECDTRSTPSTLPPIALDATFMVGEKKRDDLFVSNTLESGASDRIVEDGSSDSYVTFTALAPGVTSLVHFGAEEDSDYVDVHVEAPNALQLSEVTLADGVVTATIAAVADTLTLTAPNAVVRAVPIDAQGNLLAGAAPDLYTWTSSDPSVVSLVSQPATHMIEVVAGASGTSTLAVSVAGLSASTKVTVP